MDTNHGATTPMKNANLGPQIPPVIKLYLQATQEVCQNSTKGRLKSRRISRETRGPQDVGLRFNFAFFFVCVCVCACWCGCECVLYLTKMDSGGMPGKMVVALNKYTETRVTTPSAPTALPVMTANVTLNG